MQPTRTTMARSTSPTVSQSLISYSTARRASPCPTPTAASTRRQTHSTAAQRLKLAIRPGSFRRAFAFCLVRAARAARHAIHVARSVELNLQIERDRETVDDLGLHY